MRATLRRTVIALLGCAAIVYLALSLWSAQRARERGRAMSQWYSAVQNECARVGGIIQIIRKESERNGAAEREWAGVYGTSFRDRNLIAVSASGRAAIDVFVSCLPPTRRGFEGRIIERDGQVIHIDWAEGPEQERQDYVRGDLYFIKWGNRRMLVEAERLKDLRKAAVEFDNTGEVRWMPRCFVREGDEEKPLFGEPDWPPGFDGDGG